MATTRQPFPLSGLRFVNTGVADLTGPQFLAPPGTIGLGDLAAGLPATGLVDARGIYRFLGELTAPAVHADVDASWYQAALQIPILDDAELERFRLVVRFFLGAGLEKDQIVQFLRGINFSAVTLPLQETRLPRNQALRQVMAGDNGSWFALLPGVNPLDLRGKNLRRDLFVVTRSCPAIMLVAGSGGGKGEQPVFLNSPGPHCFLKRSELGALEAVDPPPPANIKGR